MSCSRGCTSPPQPRVALALLCAISAFSCGDDDTGPSDASTRDGGPSDSGTDGAFTSDTSFRADVSSDVPMRDAATGEDAGPMSCEGVPAATRELPPTEETGDCVSYRSFLIGDLTDLLDSASTTPEGLRSMVEGWDCRSAGAYAEWVDFVSAEVVVGGMLQQIGAAFVAYRQAGPDFGDYEQYVDRSAPLPSMYRRVELLSAAQPSLNDTARYDLGLGTSWTSMNELAYDQVARQIEQAGTAGTGVYVEEVLFINESEALWLDILDTVSNEAAQDGIYHEMMRPLVDYLGVATGEDTRIPLEPSYSGSGPVIADQQVFLDRYIQSMPPAQGERDSRAFIRAYILGVAVRYEAGPLGVDPGMIFLANLDQVTPTRIEGEQTFAAWADSAASLPTNVEAFEQLQAVKPCADFMGVCAELNRDFAIISTDLSADEVIDVVGAPDRCE